LGLIGLLVVFTGVMIRKSYFFADDFLVFGYAHKLGLRWSFVTLQLYGHIAPTERLLHITALSISPFNYAVGEAIILVLYALLLLSFLWVFRELRVGTAVTLTFLFLVGTSTVMLNETLYFGQTVFLFPSSIFILCVTALFIRWTRTGQNWALYASWLVFALSFITQERVFIVLVYLVLLRYLVLPYRVAPGGHRWGWPDWRVWLPFAAIAAAYLSYYLTIAPSSSVKPSEISNFLRLATGAFLRVAIGLPITNVARWVTWLEIVLVATSIVLLLIFSRRRALITRVVAFFVLCFAANMLPVVHGIGGVFGSKGVAYQYQYYVDALLVLGIAVGLACSSWLAPAPATRGAHSVRRDWHFGSPALVVGCVVAIAMHLILVPSGISHVRDGNRAQEIGRTWMSNLRTSLRSIDAKRPVTVVPLTMPPAFVPGFITPFDLQALVFPALPEWHDFDQGPVKVTGPAGTLLPSSAGDAVKLTSATGLEAAIGTQDLVRVDGPVDSVCYAGNAKPGQFRVSLPTAVPGVAAANLDLSTVHEITMTPFSVGGTLTAVNQLPITRPAGDHRMIVALQGAPVDVLGFTGITPHSHFCLSSLQVGSLLVATAGGNPCQRVDKYGTAYDRVACGVPWDD
jgi:hypothetical protein